MVENVNVRSVDLILETWMLCDPDGIKVDRSNVYNCFAFLAANLNSAEFQLTEEMLFASIDSGDATGSASSAEVASK